MFTQEDIIRDGQPYRYSSQKEAQLIQHVLRREGKAALGLIEGLFSENVEEMNLGMEMVTLFLYALINTVNKIESAREVGGVSRGEGDKSPAATIRSSGNIYEARSQVKFIYSMLCEPQSEDAVKDVSSWRMYKIVDYINAHFGDNMLSLEAIAEHFHITPQYLSTLFKKNMGETYSVYIQKLRLEQAKELTISTRLPLGAIAERCGFSNYLGLSRVFQKHMGMSPGAFRQSV